MALTGIVPLEILLLLISGKNVRPAHYFATQQYRTNSKQRQLQEIPRITFQLHDSRMKFVTLFNS